MCHCLDLVNNKRHLMPDYQPLVLPAVKGVSLFNVERWQFPLLSPRFVRERQRFRKGFVKVRLMNTIMC